MNRHTDTRRRSGRRGWTGLVAAGLLALAAHAPAATAHGLIVKLRDDGSANGNGTTQRLQRVLAEAGVGAAHGRAIGRTSQHLDFGHPLESAEAERLAERLRARPEVAWVVPNEREHRLQVPQDPLFPASFASSGQWWLYPAGGSNASEIDMRRRGVAGLQSAWATSIGNPAAVVAVLDTGVTRHPDLDEHVLPGRDFVSTVEYANDGDGWDADPSDPGDWVSEADRSANPTLFSGCTVDDSSWHGTVIAGMLAAVSGNGLGVTGIAWDGRVLPVRVAGKCGAEVADILVGMRWAAGLSVTDGQGRPVPVNPHPARVLNISFGGNAPCNAAYQDTIDELAAIGVIVVAAGGNDSTAPTRPANCRGVVGVAALNRDGFKSSYSNFGPALAIATVGGDPRVVGDWGMLLGDDGLLTLANTGAEAPAGASYGRLSGTSFAAPVVAGVAGLMLSVNPALTATQLIEGLRRSARPHVEAPKMGVCSAQNPGRCACSTETCGAGILDAPQALAYARDPLGYVPPALVPEVIDTTELDQAAALGPDLAQGSSSPPAAGDSGGGAVGAGWLLALALALGTLRRRPVGVVGT